MKPLLSTALSSLFSSALHFVGCYCLLTLYPTFAARYGDVSESLVGWEPLSHNLRLRQLITRLPAQTLLIQHPPDARDLKGEPISLSF